MNFKENLSCLEQANDYLERKKYSYLCSFISSMCYYDKSMADNAKRLGLSKKTLEGIKRAKSDRIRVSSFLKMLEAMGFKLTISLDIDEENKKALLKALEESN